MTNSNFLATIKHSFVKCLQTSPRSNEKLKILHGKIANDLQNLLGSSYKIYALGSQNPKEKEIAGRYMDKWVDIAVEFDDKFIAAFGVKFVMSNYSQNANNYFENMLGETANIRSNGTPYFQILILPSEMPYFKNGGDIAKIEHITPHNIEKYIRLSADNPSDFMHTPNKMLIYIVDMPKIGENLKNRKSYIKHFSKLDFDIAPNGQNFSFKNGVIYNDYETFIDKCFHLIRSI